MDGVEFGARRGVSLEIAAERCEAHAAEGEEEHARLAAWLPRREVRLAQRVGIARDGADHFEGAGGVLVLAGGAAGGAACWAACWAACSRAFTSAACCCFFI